MTFIAFLQQKNETHGLVDDEGIKKVCVGLIPTICKLDGRCTRVLVSVLISFCLTFCLLAFLRAPVFFFGIVRRVVDSRVEFFRDLILQFPFIRRSLFYGIGMADVGEDIWSKKCRVLKRKCDDLEQTNSVLYGKFLKIQKVIEDAEQEKR